MRRDFVANVSHEIRTPLTVLTGFVETLQSLPLDETERARYLELMAQQAARMQTLVSDLLDALAHRGQPAARHALNGRRWAMLNAECEDEAQALSVLLTAGQGALHALDFVPPPALAVLAGSRTELMSALSNLVAMPCATRRAGGSVKVGWQTLAAGQPEFAVEDTGPGVAPEHLPRLTERFYRVDRSRSRETGGTGLGLAIVKHVVQRHGAELRIQSVLGKGSRFAIAFPASRMRAGTAVNAPALRRQSSSRKTAAVVASAAAPAIQNAAGRLQRRPGAEAAVGQQLPAVQAHAPQQQAVDQQRRQRHAVAAQHEHADGLHRIGQVVQRHPAQQAGGQRAPRPRCRVQRRRSGRAAAHACRPAAAPCRPPGDRPVRRLARAAGGVALAAPPAHARRWSPGPATAAPCSSTAVMLAAIWWPADATVPSRAIMQRHQRERRHLDQHRQAGGHAQPQEAGELAPVRRLQPLPQGQRRTAAGVRSIHQATASMA
ncbi:MAG: ATP-binding protein [Pseudorhodoferax sp.]